MSSETLYGIVIGGLVSLLISWVFHFLQARRKKAIREQLKDLDFHMGYIGRLRESDEYRLGMAFFNLFAILFLIALGLMLPTAGSLLSLDSVIPLTSFLSLFCFVAAAGMAYGEAVSFRDLSNIERTTARIEAKRKKLQEKLEDA